MYCKRLSFVVVSAVTLVVLMIGLSCPSDALAKKPPPPDDEPYPYMLVDLLGFPDNGYQSQGMFVTNQDANGDVLIGGNSRLYPDPDGPAIFHPAMWHVDSSGNFPEDEPIDLGIPEFARGVDVEGMTSTGIIVANTKWDCVIMGIFRRSKFELRSTKSETSTKF